MRICDIPDFQAGTGCVSSKINQCSDLLDREVEVAATPDEDQAMHVFVGVRALPALPTKRLRQRPIDS